MNIEHEKHEFKQVGQEAQGVLYHVIAGLLKMAIHLLRGRGSHYLYGIVALFALVMVTRHPVFVVALVLALLRGAMALNNKDDNSE